MARHFHLETLLRLADEAQQFSNAHARNGERRTADLLWQISKALRDATSRIEAAPGEACCPICNKADHVGWNCPLWGKDAPVVEEGRREAAIDRALVLAVEDMINAPFSLYPIEPMEVSEYRDRLYRIWSPLRDAILALTPVEGAGEHRCSVCNTKHGHAPTSRPPL